MSDSEEQGYIIVTVGDDCDSRIDNDDVIIIEDSDDRLTIQPTIEGDSDDYQQPSRMSYGYIIVTVGDDCDSRIDNDDVIIIEDSDDRLTIQPTIEGDSDDYQQPSRMSYDYIVVSDGEDRDSRIDNNDVIIMEDSDDSLTVQPTIEGDSDDYQQPSRMSYEAEGLGVQGGQAVLQMNHPANFRRYNPNSVEFIPLNREGQPSTVKENNTGVREAIRNLDRKLDVIHGNVSKLQRLHAKSVRQHRKPFGFAFRNCKYRLSRRTKFQTMRKEGSPNSFSYCESSSPTSSVGRWVIDSQSIPEGGFNQSEESQETDQESLLREQEQKQKERELMLKQTFLLLSANAYQPPIVPDNPLPGTSLMPSCTRPGAANNNSILPNAPASGAAPAALLTQGESSSVYTREMKSHSVFLGNKHAVPSIYGPSGFATSSPVEPDPYVSEDPSAWSVNEVILFLQHTDPQTLGPLANLFRHHEVDGKSLLLLTIDVMMNYMGMKVGPAVKLCHYIESLKKKNSTTIEENVSV